MRLLGIFFCGVGLLSAGVPAAADEGAVKYRQKVMDAVGGTMESMVAIAKTTATNSKLSAIPGQVGAFCSTGRLPTRTSSIPTGTSSPIGIRMSAHSGKS